MKNILFILLCAGALSTAAWAQESPTVINYTVTNLTSDSTTITMDLMVTVTNNGPETIHQVSLIIPGVTGDDTAIQGAIAFDSIASGQSATAGGLFISPLEYYEGSPLDVLGWKVSYLDSQGQAQTVMILGHKQP